MFYPRRVLDINDGKPKWSGINGSSELIADTPETHKEEHKKRKREDEEKKQKESEGKVKAGDVENHESEG